MHKILSTLLWMLLTGSASAQIYKWVDSQGGVHFSDTPHEGATVITLPGEHNASPPSAPSNQASPEPLEEEKSTKLAHNYNSIEIVQPQTGATIRNNQGFVSVTAHTEPELLRGDKLQLLYDNTLLGKPQRNRVFEVNGMYRGAHTLAVQVLDAQGQVIGSSDPISIYVFRPRVGMVPGTAKH